ncbi:unnamed protein product [Angiostrongylus costaricensis]|uniref:Defective in cullin neddylation protein n=1 Tax=Angiostrongylus costaricensis TaxID=334426 RepID=A0A0R3PY17_ANGCS|nr:unnamed protein product [Angiostrongylus costaricensis]
MKQIGQIRYVIVLQLFSESYPGGIPIPGRTVPVLRLFENYAASCRPKTRREFGVDQLAQILSSLNAEEVAQKVYNQLFHSMGDVQLGKLMGKWYTVSVFFSFFPVFLKCNFMGRILGFGRMVGPDPGEVFYTTGHPSDHCPCEFLFGFI